MMDLLDRLLGHDVWTTRQMLRLCRRLTDEQLDREFDIGLRTVRATLQHVIHNIEVWSSLMAGNYVDSSSDSRSNASSVPELIVRLDRAYVAFSELARSVAQRGAWDEPWVDHLAGPPAEITYGGSIAHLITHSMHHRAQLLYLLRRLGVNNLPEGDVLSWENQAEI